MCLFLTLEHTLHQMETVRLCPARGILGDGITSLTYSAGVACTPVCKSGEPGCEMALVKSVVVNSYTPPTHQ